MSACEGLHGACLQQCRHAAALDRTVKCVLLLCGLCYTFVQDNATARKIFRSTARYFEFTWHQSGERRVGCAWSMKSPLGKAAQGFSLIATSADNRDVIIVLLGSISGGEHNVFSHYYNNRPESLTALNPWKWVFKALVAVTNSIICKNCGHI